MNDFLSSFEPTSLHELNSNSALLERSEQKYLASIHALPEMAGELSKHFYILEHSGKRIFFYENTYFDDDYQSFLNHQQGKRKRFKIRTRYYKDSEVCFLEMKVKTVQSNTDKRRMLYSVAERFHLNPEGLEFIKAIQESSYGACTAINLVPVLRISHERITLVSKNGGERMTIDLNLKTSTDTGSWDIPADVIIIETKTKKLRGIADSILRKYHIRSVKYCSKYCLAVAKTGQVSHYNSFRPILRDIERLSTIGGI